jgi:hypothetical protein
MVPRLVLGIDRQKPKGRRNGGRDGQEPVCRLQNVPRLSFAVLSSRRSMRKMRSQGETAVRQGLLRRGPSICRTPDKYRWKRKVAERLLRSYEEA